MLPLCYGAVNLMQHTGPVPPSIWVAWKAVLSRGRAHLFIVFGVCPRTCPQCLHPVFPEESRSHRQPFFMAPSYPQACRTACSIPRPHFLLTLCHTSTHPTTISIWQQFSSNDNFHLTTISIKQQLSSHGNLHQKTIPPQDDFTRLQYLHTAYPIYDPLQLQHGRARLKVVTTLSSSREPISPQPLLPGTHISPRLHLFKALFSENSIAASSSATTFLSDSAPLPLLDGRAHPFTSFRLSLMLQSNPNTTVGWESPSLQCMSLPPHHTARRCNPSLQNDFSFFLGMLVCSWHSLLGGPHYRVSIDPPHHGCWTGEPISSRTCSRSSFVKLQLIQLQPGGGRAHLFTSFLSSLILQVIPLQLWNGSAHLFSPHPSSPITLLNGIVHFFTTVPFCSSERRTLISS